ncbi:MAG: FtsX-like permease family protein, partial [Actinomycetota bacterium]
VVVVGVWTDPLDPLGAVGASTATEAGTRPSAPFGDADAFRRRLLVPHDTIVDVMSPVLGAGIENLRWRLALDPARFTGDDVGSVLGRIERLSATAERLLPGTRALRTPNGPLRAFRDDERRLRDGLASFSAPLVVLSVAVALMLVGIALRSRLGEFTSLRRRGVTRSSLVAGAIPEAAVIAAVATGVGVIVGLGLARAIGSTDTFFRFGGADDLAISMTDDAWWSAGRAGVALVLVQLLPLALLVWRIAPGGRSGGTSDRPWFQRSNLDIATVAAVAIVTWRGVTSDGGRSELIDDPAIVLLPSAAAVAGGLVILRLMPLIMRGAAAALARTDRAATLVAARRAARVPADLATPLLLLVVTASLATFTASLATTLDLQLADDVLHRNGGPVRIIDDGRPVSIASTSTPSTDEQLPLPPRTTNRHASLDAYERIWGIVRASPSIEVDGSAVHDGGTIAGFTFRGIDPITFAETSFWRPDYADRDLAALMGELVGRPDAILISEELRRTERLEVGDELRLDLLTNGGELRLATTIVGSFDQFPRWYPDRESPLIVGRADVVETLTGSTHARSVVVEVDERFGDRTQVEQDLAMFGASSLRVSSAALAIEDGRADPGRQGVLGLLTIGVAVATALTLVGFVVSTVGSLRRRTTEIGVLRAMGMTRREVGTMALFDLAAVMALGLAAALALGVGFSRWFIPVLVDTPPGAAPELLPAIAWSAIAVVAVALAGLLVVASSLVIVFVRRVRLDEAIRLGEG